MATIGSRAFLHWGYRSLGLGRAPCTQAQPQSGTMSLPQAFDLVVTKGVCVTAADVAPLDIGIKGGKIVLLAPSGSLSKAKTSRLIDAEGGCVMVSLPALYVDSSKAPEKTLADYLIARGH